MDKGIARLKSCNVGSCCYGDSLINQLREKGAALIEENEKSLPSQDAEAAIKLKEGKGAHVSSKCIRISNKKKQEIEESLAKASEKEVHKANAAAKLKEVNDQAVSLAQTQSNLQEKHEELLKSHSSATLLLQKTKSQADQIAKKKEAEAKLQEVNRNRENMLKKHTSRLDEEASILKVSRRSQLEREKRALLEKQVKEAEESLKHLDQALSLV